MKKLITIIVLAFLVINVNAQKQRVAILHPEYDMYVSVAQKDMILGALEEAFTKSEGYTPISRTALNKILDELELTLSDAFDQATVMKVGGLIGANIICASDVSKYDQSQIQVKVSLISVTTGEILRVQSQLIESNKIEVDSKVLARRLAQDVNRKEVKFSKDGGDVETIICYANNFEIIPPTFAPGSWIWYKAEKEGDNIIIRSSKNTTIDQRQAILKVKLTNENRYAEITIVQDGVIYPNEMIEKSNLNFPVYGGIQKIKMLVTNKVEIDNKPDWIQIDLPRGDVNDELVFHCDPNEKDGKRDYTIKLYIVGESFRQPYQIRITQDPAPIVSSEKISFPASGGKQIVEINSMEDRGIGIKNDKDWIKTKLQGNILTIKCDKNKLTSKRSSKLTVDEGNRQDVIKVEQEAGTVQPWLKYHLNYKKTLWSPLLSFGFVQRGYNLSTDKNEEISLWEQPENIPMILQGGLKFNSFFNPQKHGLGIDWGFYYEYALPTNKTATNPAGREYTYSFERHTAYIPVRLMFKYDLTRYFGVFVHGGAGIDCGIYENIKATYSNETTPFYQLPNKMDFSSIMNRTYISAEYGGGIQLSCVMISATFTNRVFTFNPEETFTNKQKQGLIVNFSLMF